MEKNRNITKVINIFETFAGIGSQLEAIKNIKNLKQKPVGYVEWFIPAIVLYEIFHYKILKSDSRTKKENIVDFLNQYNFSSDSKKPVSKNYWSKMNETKLRQIYPYLKRSIIKHNNKVDITKVDKIPKDIDILTYSFPCQDLSQQGKQKGISKNTRSGLLWEIERILLLNQKHLPKFLLLENVMSLTYHKFKDDLNLWIKALKKMGYYSEFKVLNSNNFGSSQSRNRVFMISRLNNSNISWPQAKKSFLKLKHILEEYHGPYLDNLLNYERDQKRTTKAGIIKQELKGYTKFNSENFIYYPEGFGPTLTASGANSRIKIVKNERLRYMTALECLKYMGFKKKYYHRIKNTKLVNDTKIIFAAGNSISVRVLKAIFKELFYE